MGTDLIEGVTLETEKFTVPFCVPSENRKDPSTSDIELAAIFALAELDRAKGGGLIVKQPEEKTLFISKIGYPLWLIPSSKNVLVFDGLNRATYTIPYTVLTDVKVFMDDLRRSIKKRETHLAFLRDHLNYFIDIQTVKEFNIRGLMATPAFLGDFKSCQQQVTQTAAEGKQENMALLTSVIDESTISTEIQELEALRVSLQNDVEDLNTCMKLLNQSAHNFVKELQDMEKTVKEEFDLKINAEKDRVAPIINDLKDEYNTKLTGLTKHYESQRAAIQKEIVKLEKEGERNEEKLKNYKDEAKKQADEDKPAVEKKWKEKIDETKKQLSQIDNQLKEADAALKNVEERREIEIFKLKDELEIKTKEANKQLAELEASRDAKLLLHQQEKEQIENETKQIIDHIGKSLKLREVDLNQFKKVGINQPSDFSGNTQLYVPFFVICYQTEQQNRYTILPPSSATTIGLTAKLRGVLRRAKIKEFLAPRFKTFSSLMDTVSDMITQNAMFETELQELCTKTNILNSPASVEEIKKGLDQLKTEGWLSAKEYAAITKELT